MFRRHLTQPLLDSLSDNPVVFLTGPRQAGKTTLARQIAADAHPAEYLSLDNLTTLAAARQDPEGFVSGLPDSVIIDEVQRAPELALAIKSAIDRDRRKGRFLLTGSANVMVLPRLSEALVGRMEVLTLWPLSQGEISGVRETFIDLLFDRDARFKTPAAHRQGGILQHITRGGFPEAVDRKRPDRRRAWFQSYLDTLLQRDIRDLASVEGVAELARILSLLAARAPAQVNYAELSRSVRVPETTLKRYLTLLEAVFLVRRLPAFSTNLGKRLVKASKLCFADSGIAAHLLGTSEESFLHGGVSAGALVETFVVSELQKQAAWSSTRPRFHHFRTASGREVDLVLENDAGECVGIEVKAGATVSQTDFAGLKTLSEVLSEKFIRGVVLSTGRDVVPFARNMHTVPIQSLWA